MHIDSQYTCLRINAGELRKHEGFVKWLNNAAREQLVPPVGPVATWHRSFEGDPPHGHINDYSDIFVWMDGVEGSNSDMPEDVWNQLVVLAGGDYHGLLWIDFLEYGGA